MPSTRRSFLGAAAAATTGLVLPGAMPGAARARPYRRDPLRLMVIGVGGRGAGNLAGVAHEKVAVLCDVDRKQLEAAGQKFPGARLVADYREILRDPAACAELDGVVVSTPDHTHFLPSMLALQQKLHVYCEKPLTYTIAEARQLLQVARANGCVTQMGIQIHANENFRRVVEAIRAGAVGTVREVVVFVNGTDWSATELPAPAPVPEHVSWDLWLGPVEPREFSPGYHPAGWRRYWAFGGGTTADMACHHMDLVFWALDLDAPTALRADGLPPHPECAPRSLRCEYEFPARGDRPAVTVRWHGGHDVPLQKTVRGLDTWQSGVLFVGDEGWLVSNYDRHEIGPAARRERWQAPAPSIPSSPGHHREWLEAIRAGTQPSCSFDYAVPLTETALLANIAYRAANGRRIRWDAAAMKADDEGANRLLQREARDGFRA